MAAVNVFISSSLSFELSSTWESTGPGGKAGKSHGLHGISKRAGPLTYRRARSESHACQGQPDKGGDEGQRHHHTVWGTKRPLIARTKAWDGWGRGAHLRSVRGCTSPREGGGVEASGRVLLGMKYYLKVSRAKAQ